MKERIDKVLVAKGLVTSRSQAQMLIEKGDVYCNDLQVTKTGFKVTEQDNLEIRTKTYVSRGAYKLEQALSEFKVDATDLIVADVGASTGGFTQVILENGAKKVYCIDVGHDQLHESLLNDSRAINMEGTHIDQVLLPEKVSLCIVDLSFISILKVIRSIMNLLDENGRAIILIKPQFEAGKERMGKNAVLEPQVSEQVFLEVCEKLKKLNYHITQRIESPILGKQGNKEYLIELRNEG